MLITFQDQNMRVKVKKFYILEILQYAFNLSSIEKNNNIPIVQTEFSTFA